MEILIRDTPEEGARVASRLVRKILSIRSNPVLGWLPEAHHYVCIVK